MRRLNVIIAVLFPLLSGGCAPVQQQPERASMPTMAELRALGECEEAALGGGAPSGRIRWGTYDVTLGQWLIVGEKRDEVVSCLVVRHGWVALSAPDGRRGARAPR